ncbi:MAG: peptidase S58 family protein, partial [Actinobacteria bacterium]|nr:peptidase S58 family protein [Actinomycetota bacterium]
RVLEKYPRFAERSFTEHDALAGRMRPAHTRLDGDIAFAVSCGSVDAEVEVLAEAAFGATASALENAVRSAAS